MPEAGRTEITGHRRYICESCELVFLDEEVGLRYSRSRKRCIRCIVVERLNDGLLELPSCYGIEYDGSLRECTQLCAVREACIIQIMEDKTWELSHDRSHGTAHRMSYEQVCVRILRAAGRPMHWKDLWPILEKQTVGRYKNSGHHAQLGYVRTELKSCKDIAFLGDNYFMWAALWRPEMGGRLGHSRIGYVRSPETKTLNQILREMDEQGKH